MSNLPDRPDRPDEPRRFDRGSSERYRAAKQKQDANITPVFHDNRQAVLGVGGQAWHADGLLRTAGSLQKAFEVLLAAYRSRRSER